MTAAVSAIHIYLVQQATLFVVVPGGVSPSYILKEGTHPVTRAIGAFDSHSLQRLEFRQQNIRSHSLREESCIFICIIYTARSEGAHITARVPQIKLFLFFVITEYLTDDY